MNVMSDLKASSRRTSADLIDAIVDNMRQNLEELKYATLAPSRYTVYLSAGRTHAPRRHHPAPAGRGDPRAGRGAGAAQSAVAGSAAPVGTWLPGVAGPPLENAGPRWHIEFLRGHGRRPRGRGRHHRPLGSGAGPRIRSLASANGRGASRPSARATTRRRARRSSPAPTAARRPCYARLTYRDKLGAAHTATSSAIETTIGRGGTAFPVDIRVSTSEDVSREHARIRRDAASGQFYLIDLSTLGTTLNGRHVPRGVEDAKASSARTAPRPRCRRARASAWPTRCSWTSSRSASDVPALGAVRPAGGARDARGRARAGRCGRAANDSCARRGRAPTSAPSATSTRIASTSIAERGIFIVIDGVGGQAAGGRAADTALDVIRARRLADRERRARASHSRRHHDRQQRSASPGRVARRNGAAWRAC